MLSVLVINRLCGHKTYMFLKYAYLGGLEILGVYVRVITVTA